MTNIYINDQKDNYLIEDYEYRTAIILQQRCVAAAIKLQDFKISGIGGEMWGTTRIKREGFIKAAERFYNLVSTNEVGRLFDNLEDQQKYLNVDLGYSKSFKIRDRLFLGIVCFLTLSIHEFRGTSLTGLHQGFMTNIIVKKYLKKSEWYDLADVEIELLNNIATRLAKVKFWCPKNQLKINGINFSDKIHKIDYDNNLVEFKEFNISNKI